MRSRKIIYIWLIFILIVALVCISVLLNVEYRNKLVEVVWGTKSHDLNCDQLPEMEKVNQVFNQNKSKFENLKQKYPNIQVSLQNWGEIPENVSDTVLKNCPGKADISFGTETRQETEAIKKEFGPSIDGVPYRIEQM
jgi:hypothetical protein